MLELYVTCRANLAYALLQAFS